jgi:hypothetical protein
MPGNSSGAGFPFLQEISAYRSDWFQIISSLLRGVLRLILRRPCKVGFGDLRIVF